MKSILMNSLFILFLLFAACGQGSDSMKKFEDQNYTPPSLLTQPRFFYPALAQDNAYAGNTKIYIIVNKEGKVTKTTVVKSSGYEVLDKASTDYCKALTFKPAKKDGAPVDARLIWEIKYNLSNQNWSTETYLKNVVKLINNEITSPKDEKKKVREEILNLHNEFTKTMNDRMNYNIIIEQVISPAISMEWQKDWEGWPLSFLLYYDFIKRYPDYDSLSKIQNLMKNSLKADIQYINSTTAEDVKMENKKEKLLMKIRTFIKNEFPDALSSEFGFNNTAVLKPIS